MAAAILTMSIVNDRLAVAFAARRSMVKMRYIGDAGMTSRMRARTSASSPSARADFMTFLRQERGDHTLEPAALVNEVAVRLLGSAPID